MWVAMAIYQYGKVTGDHSYDAFAQGIIDYALTNFQQVDGGINQGLNYDRSILPWASVEENQDALAVMRMFGRVDAELEVFDFLDSWYIVRCDYGLYRFATGRGNYDPFMDVNPWGVLTMGSDYADSCSSSRRGCSRPSNPRPVMTCDDLGQRRYLVGRHVLCCAHLQVVG